MEAYYQRSQDDDGSQCNDELGYSFPNAANY